MMNVSLEECDGGVTAPKGFIAGGLFCGIRKAKKDLAMLVSEPAATVAAVFTQNRMQAAPILVNKAQLKKTATCTAVVVNSGNANACTGERGLNDAWAMARVAADALGLPAEQVLVSSTGVIGQFLPIDNVCNGIKELSSQLRKDGANDAATAIMTTDTYSKEYAVKLTLGGAQVTIGAMAKGSGMIAPNMATMLGFVTTDADISHELLNSALQATNRQSFNRITVDGDMSTNDMVLLLANGTAGNAPIVDGDSADYGLFVAALQHVMITLAKMIAADGEGATKLIEVTVTGARTEDEAEQVAKAVASSNLVKTAVHGADANWGRIMAAVGYSHVEFDPHEVTIAFNDLPVLDKDYNVVLDEAKAKEILSQREITITIDLDLGNCQASVWTCDLTKEYVHINASYRS
jgi:glutamate N-acetyltransferase/amino-acid N-acetyltransferase